MRILALIVPIALMCACTPGPMPRTSPGPAEPWTAEREETLPELPAGATIPPEFTDAAQHFTLPQLVDLALRFNERTKISWLRARAAAASLGASKGELYPQIVVGAEFDKNKNPFSIGENTGEERYGPFATVSWLIFDFGRREANINQFRQALVEANYTHNAEIQNVIFDVTQAFYRYVRLKALAQSQDITLAENAKNVDYAEQRHKAGLATIADVLQAKTSYSRAKFDRQTTEGEIQGLRGLVATSVGFAPDTPFEIAPVDIESMPIEAVTESVGELISEAESANPELRAARAEASRAQAEYDASWLRRLPSLGGDWRPEKKWREGDSDTGYLTSVEISVPIFTGGSLSYDIERSRHERDIAAAQMRDTSKALALRVWNDYFLIKTAEQQVETSKELLESALASFDVASARYREGVGTILDLLAAQSALEEARASVVNARTAWLIAVAALTRDSGRLNMPKPEAPVS